jgi:hypothetical protein
MKHSIIWRLKQLFVAKPEPKPSRPDVPPKEVPAFIAGTVFEDCYVKDPELAWRLMNLTMPAFWREWIKVYPEDFAGAGLTHVSDRTAIKPRSQVSYH